MFHAHVQYSTVAVVMRLMCKPTSQSAAGTEVAAKGTQAGEGPTLSSRITAVAAMLAAARNGTEQDLVEQLESRLTALKELQQAEHPYAARLQSAVDRAATKKAAKDHALGVVTELRKQLAEAETVWQAAEAASTEADVALASLQAQGAGASSANATGPTLEGADEALKTVFKTAPEGAYPAAAVKNLEAALLVLLPGGGVPGPSDGGRGSGSGSTTRPGSADTGTVNQEGQTPPQGRSRSQASHRSVDRERTPPSKRQTCRPEQDQLNHAMLHTHTLFPRGGGQQYCQP